MAPAGTRVSKTVARPFESSSSTRHRASRRADGVGDRDAAAVAHVAVLKFPGPQNLRPSDVAMEAGMAKQAANYLLGQLEETGHLVRTIDPDDRRSRRIHLAERGLRCGGRCARPCRRSNQSSRRSSVRRSSRSFGGSSSSSTTVPS